jgi:hypothetical protein
LHFIDLSYFLSWHDDQKSFRLGKSWPIGVFSLCWMSDFTKRTAFALAGMRVGHFEWKSGFNIGTRNILAKVFDL